MLNDAAVLARLTRASERPRGPMPGPGPEVADALWTSPELVTLYGTPFWDGLSPSARQRLSFWEAVAFFSLNVHNERRLVAGAQLRRGQDPQLSAYLDHFVREEAEHTEVFRGFCQRHAGGVLPDRSLVLTAAREDDFVFFARVLLFEGIVDHYNRIMAGDARLAPAVRAIHRYHHRDEARHLAFGRLITRRLWRGDQGAARGLRDYLVSVGRELVSVDAYRLAGVADPYETRRAVLASPAHRRRLAEAAAAPCRLFAKLGLEVGV
jgi:hypothetical protein